MSDATHPMNTEPRMDAPIAAIVGGASFVFGLCAGLIVAAFAQGVGVRGRELDTLRPRPIRRMDYLDDEQMAAWAERLGRRN